MKREELLAKVKDSLDAVSKEIGYLKEEVEGRGQLGADLDELMLRLEELAKPSGVVSGNAVFWDRVVRFGREAARLLKYDGESLDDEPR